MAKASLFFQCDATTTCPGDHDHLAPEGSATRCEASEGHRAWAGARLLPAERIISDKKQLPPPLSRPSLFHPLVPTLMPRHHIASPQITAEARGCSRLMRPATTWVSSGPRPSTACNTSSVQNHTCTRGATPSRRAHNTRTACTQAFCKADGTSGGIVTLHVPRRHSRSSRPED